MAALTPLPIPPTSKASHPSSAPERALLASRPPMRLASTSSDAARSRRRSDRVKRREFITLLGGAAAAWPLAARAQQPTMPVVGFLDGQSFDLHLMMAFRQALKDAGYVEGRNVAIYFRSADGQTDRLVTLAGDIVGQRVTVIVTAGGGAPRPPPRP